MSGWLRRNALVVVFVAIATGIAAWAFTRSPALAPGLRDLPIARARLAECLLGQPVERTGPDIVRLRAIQLAGDATWPKRCAPYAAAVERVLPHDGGSRHDEASSMLAAGELFENLSVSAPIGALLTPEFGEPTMPLATVAHDVLAAPTPVPIAHDVAAIAFQESPLSDLGDHDLALGLGHQVTCRFAARDGGLDNVAHCSYPADALARTQWSAVRATTAADLLVATDDGIHKFAGGELVMAVRGVTAASDVDGTLFVWPADATRTSVLRRDPTGTTTILRLPHSLGRSATLVRDQLLWTENERVVGLGLAGAKVGAVYEVAKPATLSLEDTCATSEIAAALVVKGKQDYRVAVFANGAWQLQAQGPRYELHCTGATVTGLVAELRASSLEIERIDCTAAGCTRGSATIEHIAGPHAVAAIGGDTIVVWADDLVRAISGPLAMLPTAKRYAVYDGARFEQLSTKNVPTRALVTGLDVVGRGASAIVVLDADGIRLVHVRDRKPERVTVVFD